MTPEDSSRTFDNLFMRMFDMLTFFNVCNYSKLSGKFAC